MQAVSECIPWNGPHQKNKKNETKDYQLEWFKAWSLLQIDYKDKSEGSTQIYFLNCMYIYISLNRVNGMFHRETVTFITWWGEKIGVFIKGPNYIRRNLLHYIEALFRPPTFFPIEARQMPPENPEVEKGKKRIFSVVYTQHLVFCYVPALNMVPWLLGCWTTTFIPLES